MRCCRRLVVVVVVAVFFRGGEGQMYIMKEAKASPLTHSLPNLLDLSFFDERTA